MVVFRPQMSSGREEVATRRQGMVVFRPQMSSGREEVATRREGGRRMTCLVEQLFPPVVLACPFLPRPTSLVPVGGGRERNQYKAKGSLPRIMNE